MAFYCIHCRSEIDSKYKACPFCGEAITDFLRRYLETTIDGKYQILARLGVGGMGEVYKVLHIHLNSIRVIKLMRSAIMNEAGAHDRFLREARLATRIHHPNVATLFDFSTLDDGSLYMVWEYIEGTNLHEVIESRGPLSPRYAATLATQALHGLDAIHRAGIVHRDISPENLMIARDDEGEERVKIIDLGIAKQWGDESDNKTKTGMFVGKWKYCSPEHLGMLPEGQRIDARADLYSFGIVLYEMLTGVPPFQADTPHSYLVMHASERPRALRQVNPTVTASPELESIIFRALEKDRNKRFGSAREFARTIEQITSSLDDKPGSPAPLPTAIEVTEEPTRVIDTSAPTVATMASAETVQTLGGPPPAPAPPARSPALYWAVAAAIMIVIVTAGAMMLRKQPTSVMPPPSKRVVTASVVTVATAHLGVNAFPWAEVRSIRNITSGQTIDLKAPLVTPAPIDLAPGKYEITFFNPAFHRPITKTVELRPGDEQMIVAEFTAAANAALPRFEGTR
jgi:serine/threonine-protein kinase